MADPTPKPQLRDVHYLLSKIVEWGYIRSSDVAGIDEGLCDDGITLTDKIMPGTGEVPAAKMNELEELKLKVSTLESDKAYLDKECQRLRDDLNKAKHTGGRSFNGSTAPLHYWVKPGEVNDVRVYLNCKGLRKVYMYPIGDAESSVGLRGQFGRNVTHNELAISQKFLKQLGLDGCTWDDVLEYLKLQNQVPAVATTAP